MQDSERRIPRTNVVIRFRCVQLLNWLTKASFLNDMGLTNDPRITAILEAAQAFVLAVDTYDTVPTHENHVTLVDAREHFLAKYREMYDILTGVNVDQDTKDLAYARLFMKNPRFNDKTKTPTPEPTSSPVYKAEIKGIGLVDLILQGDSVNTTSKALPHDGFIRFLRILLVLSDVTLIIDESYDIIHLSNNDHIIHLNLANFLSRINGDVKLVVISSYINRVGIHGPSGDPVFLPLPKWGPGNPNAKKKNKGSEGSAEGNEGDDEGDE